LELQFTATGWRNKKRIADKTISVKKLVFDKDQPGI